MTASTKNKKGRNKVNYNDKRTFLWLGDLKRVLNERAKSDPRFKSVSEYVRHLLPLAFKADAKARQEALGEVE